MEAAREGHEDVVQLLVEHGANVNAQTEETQETALTLACCGGFLEVAQYLIDHGEGGRGGRETEGGGGEGGLKPSLSERRCTEPKLLTIYGIRSPNKPPAIRNDIRPCELLIDVRV